MILTMPEYVREVLANPASREKLGRFMAKNKTGLIRLGDQWYMVGRTSTLSIEHQPCDTPPDSSF